MYTLGIIVILVGGIWLLIARSKKRLAANPKGWQVPAAILGGGGVLLILGIVCSVVKGPSNEVERIVAADETESLTTLPDYIVLNEDVSDAPVKTQVVMDILVSGEITKEGLETLLNDLYSSIKQRTGFEYHDHPNAIYIRAYTSQERAESGMQIAMLEKNAVNDSPLITINENQIAQLGAKSDEKFGLSEEQRKEIWKAYILAERQAREEADKKYPPEQVTTKEELRRLSEYEANLKDKYLEDLAKKHGLTRDQLELISIEGLEKEWPFPG